MGRGRQKAKQQKIARKLKYLTTDTDYDELAKELSAQETDAEADVAGENVAPQAPDSSDRVEHQQKHESDPAPVDDDLDEYAKWAAEAAAKVTGSENTSVRLAAKPHGPARRKPIPIPLPSVLKAPKKG